MKKKSGIAVLAALLTAGAVQTAVAQTNVTLDLDFYLTTVSQGTITTNNGVVSDGVKLGLITEATIIKDLGASTSNSFSARAELLLLLPTNAPNDWTVLVRDGTNSVDVTGFFEHIPGTNSVGSTFVEPRTKEIADTEYSIDGFRLRDQAGFPALSTHFHVSGFTITDFRGIVSTASGVTGITEAITANVAGAGEKDGDLVIIEGTINARGNSLAAAPVTSGPAFGR